MLNYLRAAIAAALAILIAAPAAMAQSWPEKPIRILVGFSPGSTLDVMARALSAPLTKQLGQSVFVENKPGSSGTLALNLLGNATPDGYTLELAGTGPISISPYVQGVTLPPLQPVGLVGHGPMALVVDSNLPIKSLKELVALAKSKEVFYGSPGVGSTPHLAAELFAIKAGVKLTHVPYKGNVDAINDVLAGRIQITWSGLPPLMPQVTAGKLRALAIAGPERSSALPDVPTVSEAGVPGAEALSHYGFLAPKNVPPQVIARLNAEVTKAVAQPEIVTLFNNLGSIAKSSSPDEYGKIIADDTELWKKVIAEAKITPN